MLSEIVRGLKRYLFLATVGQPILLYIYLTLFLHKIPCNCKWKESHIHSWASGKAAVTLGQTFDGNSYCFCGPSGLVLNAKSTRIGGRALKETKSLWEQKLQPLFIRNWPFRSTSPKTRRLGYSTESGLLTNNRYKASTCTFSKTLQTSRANTYHDHFIANDEHNHHLVPFSRPDGASKYLRVENKAPTNNTRPFIFIRAHNMS